MSYRVHYTEGFTAQLDGQIGYLLGQQVAVRTIDRWYQRLLDEIDELSMMPRRYPIDDARTAESGQETRKLSIGDYLIFYQVDDADHQVNLIAFIHGARDRDG